MKSRIVLSLCAAAALALAIALPSMAQAAAAQGNNAVAKVNGVPIPQSRLDLLIKNTGQPDTPEVRDRLKFELITGEMLVQEAVKKGIDKTPEFAVQMELQRQTALINAYLQNYVKTHPIGDDVIKKEYERVKAEAGTKEYRARHILVDKEDEAKQIIAQLKKGGNFGKIAAERSKDSGTKDRGGDLDWSPANRYVPSFANALRKLKKGQLSDTPVQTQFGWHVIRLDDERAMKFPPFDQVKPQIKRQMEQQMLSKMVADLRAKTKVE